MKPTSNPFLRTAFSSFKNRASLLLAVSASLVASSSATILYWDLNGATANSGTSGTGAWNGTSAFWNTEITGTGGTAQAGTLSTDDLVFSSGSGLTSGTITVTAGRLANSITFEESGVYTLSSGSITLYGANSLIFKSGTGANVVGSGLTLNASTSFTNNDDSTQTINGGINSSTGASITNSGTGTGALVIGGVIGSGISSIIQNSSTSQLTLSGANSSFSGDVLVKAGTIHAQSNGSAFGTGTIRLGDLATNAAATLSSNLASSAPVANAIVLTEGVTAALTITSPNTGSPNTFTGGVTGTNNLILTTTGSTNGGMRFSTNAVNNTGTVTAKSTTGTGPIVIDILGTNVTSVSQAGTTAFTINSALALTTTNRTLVSTGSGAFTFNGGITGSQDLVLNANSTGGITIGTAAADNTGTITNSGTGVGASTLSGGVGSNVTSITQNSATSALNLSGVNTNFAGPVNLTAGTLRLSSATALGGAGSATGTGGALNIAAGTTLDASATTVLTTTNAKNINGSFSYAGTASLTFGPGAISLASTPITVTNTGANSFNFGTGAITGTSDLTLRSNAAGAITVGGLLNNTGSVSTAGTGAGTNSFSGGLGTNVTGFNHGSVAAATVGAITLGQNFAITSTSAAGLFTANAGITGAYNLTLNANAAGGITLSTVSVNNGGSITNSGSGTGITTISVAIGSNVGSVIQNSANGALTLSSGSNAFTGGLVIKQGRVNLNASGAQTTNAITIGENGGGAASLFTNSGGTFTLSNAIVFASGATGPLTIGSSINGSTTTYSGAFTLNGNNVNVAANGTGNITLSASYVGSGSLTNTGSGTGIVTASGALGSSISGVTQTSATSTLSLTNIANTFGSLTIRNGTVLGTQNAAGSVFGSGIIYLGDASSTAANLNTAGTAASFSNAIVLGSAGTLTITATAGATSYSGGITGTNDIRLNTGTGTGTLTFSGAQINNTGTVTNNTVTGTGALTISSGIGSNVTGVIQNSATSAFILSGTSTYTAATSISAGSFTLASGGSLAGTAITAATGTSFIVSGDSIIGTSGSASVNIADGATLSLLSGSINNLTLNSATSGADVLNFTGATGSTLSLDLLGSTSDTITLGSGLKASLGAGVVTINPNAIGALTSGTRTLITASGGGLTSGGGFALNTSNGNFGGNQLSLNVSSTAVQLNVTAAGAAPSVLYFTGVLDDNFGTFTGGNTNNSNFSSTADGTTDAHIAPDSGTELHIQATSLPSAVRTITLGRDISVKSLFIDSNVAHALTIASGGAGNSALTLTPTSSTDGIVVNSTTGGTVSMSHGVILGASQTFTNNTANALTISGNITSTGAADLVLKSNAALGAATNNGLITLSGSVNHSGSIVNSGTGTGTGGNTNGVTISGVIGTNVTSITQNASSSNVLTLSGAAANTFTGPTTITSGILLLNKTTAGMNALNGNILINGGHLSFGNDQQIADTASVTMTSGSFNTTAGTVNVGYGALDEVFASLTVSGSGLFNNGSASQVTGVVITGNASFTGGSNAAFFTGSGGLFTANSLTVTNMSRTGAAASGVNNSDVTNGFIVYGNNARQTVISVGSGGLNMNGTSSANNIVLRTGGSGTVGSKLVIDGNVTTTGTFNSSILHDTAGGTTGTVSLDLSSASAAVTRTFNIGGPEFRVNVGVRNGASTAAGIEKTGAGILVLNAASSYTGATTVTNGTLLINGNNSAATGAVTVANGATLGGSGTVGGATVINGTHAAGNNAIGSQTFASSLNYSESSTFTWQLGSETTTGAGTNFDSITVNGGLDIDGGVFKIVVTNLNLDSTFWASNKTWDIFEGSTGTGNFNSFQLYNSNNVSFNYASYGSFSFAASSGQLSWTVPEPTNALAGVLIAAGMLRRRRNAVK